MEIKILCVMAEEISEMLGQVTAALSNALGQVFGEKDYGANIGQFSAVVVAVYSDESENRRFCVAHDKVGSFKNWMTGDRIKFISFSLPFDPMVLEKLSRGKVINAICDALIDRLRSPGVKIPKGFDYESFSNDMKTALEIYRKALAN